MAGEKWYMTLMSCLTKKEFYKYNYQIPLIINPMFINFLNSSPKSKNLDDKLFDLIMDDFLKEFKKSKHLKLYSDGYRRGYGQGYFEGIRFFKKFKKE